TIQAPTQLTGYEYQVQEVVEALESGKTECASMPHAETIHIMELMDEIRGQLGVKYPFDE
ncbi:MAG: gfo/Idh/MocA family oxidoreductase, partial [Clostridia bacterium]|nr:gfo/Idh/MocA family oxidoreductase [Clostridia bacterium]